MRVGAAAVLLALTLAACGAPEQQTEAASPTQAPVAESAAKADAPKAQPAAEQPVFLGDPCSAELYQDLIGRSEAYARGANLPEGARVICHECAKTDDSVPRRLNVQIGADGAVRELTCG
ncbi:MAG: hypothetical protein GC206_09110 [Alphaproteobacteria bacterium]|nr:hypothetical protein [Alphaproteobacteria bacterium]